MIFFTYLGSWLSYPVLIMQWVCEENSSKFKEVEYRRQEVGKRLFSYLLPSIFFILFPYAAWLFI
jgi:hypothetical protein